MIIDDGQMLITPSAKAATRRCVLTMIVNSFALPVHRNHSETGAKVCLQLNHSGGMFGDRGRSDLQPISASTLEYGKNHKLAKAATIDEIHTLQSKFIMAAERAQMAGFVP